MIEMMIMVTTTTVICGNDGDVVDNGDNKADIGVCSIYGDVEKDIPFKSLRAIGLPTDKRLMTSDIK